MFPRVVPVKIERLQRSVAEPSAKVRLKDRACRIWGSWFLAASVTAHPKVRALRCPPGPHGIGNGKKIPWEGELNLRFDP